MSGTSNGLKGLKGLRGLYDLSRAEQDAFLSKNAPVLAKYADDPINYSIAAKRLYENQKFIDKFGIDRFRELNNGQSNAFNLRADMLKDTLALEEYQTRFKGNMDDDMYNKYMQLSSDGKIELLKSEYLTPKEFDNKWKDYTKKGKERQSDMESFLSNLTSSHHFGDRASDLIAQDMMYEENQKKVSSDFNQRIIDNIFSKDVKRQAEGLTSEVDKEYYNLIGIDDDTIKKEFIQAITANPTKGNLGIPSYQAYYGNGDSKSIEDEMQNFSIDDMRRVLAKKKAYENYMSLDMTRTALEDEAKEYIADHQGSLTKFGLFMNDVGISAMSYTADKINGIGEIGRYIQDKSGDIPTVWVDDQMQVIDPNKTKIIKDKAGRSFYYDEDKNLHPVHLQKVSNRALHNMGKNSDGSDIKGMGSIDWLTLNPQYWNRAEQFGTLDEDEQKQYENIGVSPYKIMYRPEDNGDLLYESFKMMSFGVADMASQLIPFGIGAAGKALSTTSKLGKVGQYFGKALDAAGKLLTAETKTGQIIQGTSGALGIAYAYNRGAFQESLLQNLERTEKTVTDKARHDIYDRYNNDKDYKTTIDNLINVTAEKMKKDYLSNLQAEGGARPADMKAIDQMIHAKAQDAVLEAEVQKNIEEQKLSKNYADLQQRAIDGAGDAAFNTYWTEGLKYGLVNNLGHRKFMYQNPSGTVRKLSTSLKGLKEITTKEGLKRLGTEASKFLTRGQKLKEFGKTVGSQIWGGAWTNGTDDMQTDAAERINEDSYSRYLNSYYNGEALADTYGFLDGMYSAVKGLQNSMGQETTWNAAAVGGLGGPLNFNLHFTNIASLATKKGREHYRDTYMRKIKRDENGIPIKDEKGNLQYDKIKKRDNWRERVNFFVQNGVLNTYYGKKMSERDLQSHADFINNLLDSHHDFETLEHLVAAGITSNNLINVGDEKTSNFINALLSIQALNALRGDSNDPSTFSSVITKAKNLIDKASELNLEEGKNPFTEEEIHELLAEYYAQHPELTRSEAHNQKALYDIAVNAQKLKEAATAIEKATDEVNKIEKRTKQDIHPQVKQRIIMNQVLSNHWQERKSKMQSEIDDGSSDEKPTDHSTIVASVGGRKNATELVDAYDQQQGELQKELSDQVGKNEELKKAYQEAVKATKEAKKVKDNEKLLVATEKEKQAKDAFEDGKQQENYIMAMLEDTQDKKELLQDAIKTVSSSAKEEQQNETDRGLTADEIFGLDPVTRARMLRKDHRELYSRKQQIEIEKLERRLVMRDADALEKIQDIGLLTQRINTAKDAYSRLAQNPEAAATAFENQRIIAAKSAAHLINVKNAETVADWTKQVEKDFKDNLLDISENELKDFFYRRYRTLNSKLLDMIEERDLIPEYQKQIADAKEWCKTVEDIDAIIYNSDKTEEEQQNLKAIIDNIVDDAFNKEDIINTFERIIDEVEDPKAVEDFEFLLKGMEKMGYQRDATTLENREQRKAREKSEREKREEEQKKIETEAKDAAEKKAAEDRKVAQESSDAERAFKEQQAANAQPKNEVAADGSNLSSPLPEDAVDRDHSNAVMGEPLPGAWNVGFLLDDEYGDGSINAGSIWYGTSSNPQKEDFVAERKGNHISFKVGNSKTSLDIAPNEYTSSKGDDRGTFKATSMEKKDGEWYFEGTFEGSEESTQVKMKKDFDIDQAIEKQKALKEAEFTMDGVNTGSKNIVVSGDNVSANSGSLESQIEEEKKRGVSIQSSENFTSVDNINTNGEKNINSDETTLSGNAMSRYAAGAKYNFLLENDGILQRKKGNKENDSMNKYYAWMDAAGIKLQNIIDTELARIIQANPHAKVKFMAIKDEDNATHDYDMFNHLMLVLDYDDNVNKKITSIHNDENGGVIESMGKKYLVIGTVGYGNRNAGKLALYDMLWSPYLAGGHNLKTKRHKFFLEHPDERFYVNEALSTEIVPTYPIPGYVVRQMEEDKGTQFRKVSEILEGPEEEQRNPLNLSFNRVAWGIQEGHKFLIVGAVEEEVMIPRNAASNMGNAFVLIPASNGKLIPSYLKPLKYTEMQNGTLKDKVEALLNKVCYASANVSEASKIRIAAIVELSQIFHFDIQKGDGILSRKSANVISLVKDGKQIGDSFVLDNDFDRNAFFKAFEQLNPRVNITARVLGNTSLLREYDEAGALTTDLALFHTAGSSYHIYGIDAEGNMIMPKETRNIPPKGGNSDFRNENRSQIIFRHNYYTEENGNFFLNNIPVTNENDLIQLRYNKRVMDNQIEPVVNVNGWNYYILSAGEHPEVIKINNNTYEVIVATEEQAKQLVEKVIKEKEEKRREEEAEKSLEAAKAQGLPENAQDVDLGDITTIDPATGEIITTTPPQANTPIDAENTLETGIGNQLNSSTEKELANTGSINHSSEGSGNRDMRNTQKCSDILNNKKYKIKLLKLMQKKMGKSNIDIAVEEMEEFLKKRDIEIDNIGTSEDAVNAWIKTVEKCR